MPKRGSVESEIMQQINDAEVRVEEKEFHNRIREGRVRAEVFNGEEVERPKPWWALLRRSWPRPKRRGW